MKHKQCMELILFLLVCCSQVMNAAMVARPSSMVARPSSAARSTSVSSSGEGKVSEVVSHGVTSQAPAAVKPPTHYERFVESVKNTGTFMAEKASNFATSLANAYKSSATVVTSGLGLGTNSSAAKPPMPVAEQAPVVAKSLTFVESGQKSIEQGLSFISESIKSGVDAVRTAKYEATLRSSPEKQKEVLDLKRNIEEGKQEVLPTKGNRFNAATRSINEVKVSNELVMHQKAADAAKSASFATALKEQSGKSVQEVKATESGKQSEKSPSFIERNVKQPVQRFVQEKVSNVLEVSVGESSVKINEIQLRKDLLKVKENLSRPLSDPVLEAQRVIQITRVDNALQNLKKINESMKDVKALDSLLDDFSILNESPTISFLSLYNKLDPNLKAYVHTKTMTARSEKVNNELKTKAQELTDTLVDIAENLPPESLKSIEVEWNDAIKASSVQAQVSNLEVLVKKYQK